MHAAYHECIISRYGIVLTSEEEAETLLPIQAPPVALVPLEDAQIGYFGQGLKRWWQKLTVRKMLIAVSREQRK